MFRAFGNIDGPEKLFQDDISDDLSCRNTFNEKSSILYKSTQLSYFWRSLSPPLSMFLLLLNPSPASSPRSLPGLTFPSPLPLH